MANSSAPGAHESLVIIGLSLLVFFTLVGNSFVLVVLLCRAKRLLKKPLYIFICNICLSDVLSTLFTMTFEVYEEVTHEWKFGEPACKAIEYLEMTLFGVNIFTHLSIAAERYRNVVQPLKPPMKLKTAKTFTLLSWVIPIVMALPYLYTLRLKDHNGNDICVTEAMPSTWLDKLFLSVELLAIFLIPLGSIIFMYYAVVRTLHQRNRRVNGVLAAPHRATMRAAATYGSRVSVAVVSVFIVCWMPLVIVYIVRLVTHTEKVDRVSTLYVVALYSSFVSELLTPLLYCAFDRNIRPALMATLRCKSRVVIHSEDSQSDRGIAPRSRTGTLAQPTDPESCDACFPRGSSDS